MRISSPRQALHQFSAPLIGRDVIPFRLAQTVISFTFDDYPRSALDPGGRILHSEGTCGTYYTAFGLAQTGVRPARSAASTTLRRAWQPVTESDATAMITSTARMPLPRGSPAISPSIKKLLEAWTSQLSGTFLVATRAPGDENFLRKEMGTIAETPENFGRWSCWQSALLNQLF
jgi:hypothetical protein